MLILLQIFNITNTEGSETDNNYRVVADLDSVSSVEVT